MNVLTRHAPQRDQQMKFYTIEKDTNNIAVHAKVKEAQGPQCPSPFFPGRTLAQIAKSAEAPSCDRNDPEATCASCGEVIVSPEGGWLRGSGRKGSGSKTEAPKPCLRSRPGIEVGQELAKAEYRGGSNAGFQKLTIV